MKTQELPQLLRKNPYPGRGVVLGVTPDGRQSAALYFIMGRSANSRNRVFVQEPDGIRTQARDPEKMEDPSLVIYHPVRRVGRSLIVTNGDQTDTILEYLERGQTLEQALRSREFEPDSPNWTPRISGLLSPDGGYKLSILKSANEKGSACLRQFHTYVQDGSPLPTFEGEPERVEIGQDMEAFARQVWESLNEENKISLFVQYTSLETGEARQLIFNKYE